MADKKGHWTKTPDDPKNTGGRTPEEYNKKRDQLRSDQRTGQIKGAVTGAIAGAVGGGFPGAVAGAMGGYASGGVADAVRLNGQKHDAQKYGVIPGDSMMGHGERISRDVNIKHDAMHDARAEKYGVDKDKAGPIRQSIKQNGILGTIQKKLTGPAPQASNFATANSHFEAAQQHARDIGDAAHSAMSGDGDTFVRHQQRNGKQFDQTVHKRGRGQ